MRAVRLDPIDEVLALDLGRRGIADFSTPGAALSAAHVLRGARRALIVTGFCIPPGLPETDGPPGAAVLGRALGLLGATVRYVTDPAVVPPLRAALEALATSADIVVYPEEADPRTLLARERPTHLVAIERPGRTRSGDYLSVRGEPVAAWNRPIDELFMLARNLSPSLSPNLSSNLSPNLSPKTKGRAVTRDSIRPPSAQADLAAPATTTGGSAASAIKRPTTIAVGDGGNEIGMGNVRARLCRQGRLMARVASVVRVDHLVVAGTSNWGAYGIVAGLERLTGQALLHTPDQERRLIEACVEAGAVDGITRSAEPTVDGLPLDVHAAVVELLWLAATSRHRRRAIIGLEG